MALLPSTLLTVPHISWYLVSLKSKALSQSYNILFPKSFKRPVCLITDSIIHNFLMKMGRFSESHYFGFRCCMYTILVVALTNRLNAGYISSVENEYNALHVLLNFVQISDTDISFSFLSVTALTATTK